MRAHAKIVYQIHLINQVPGVRFLKLFGAPGDPAAGDIIR